MADADRLRAIQDDYSRALEGRITDLMTKVHAAREINRQVADLGRQIDSAEADVAALQAELGEYDRGSEEYELGVEQIQTLRGAIDETRAWRGELVDGLAKLAGEIGG